MSEQNNEQRSQAAGTDTVDRGNSNAKLEQLEAYREDATGEALSTNTGTRIADNQNTLKAGERGPSLLEDFIMREKITHFDHERIPERVVHARGSAAHGYFEAYEDLSDLTKAGFLAEAGKRTPVFVRFSTVQGPRGSADTVRDVRGFAVKFYTDEGQLRPGRQQHAGVLHPGCDQVPDFVHAVKPEPHNGDSHRASAHDTFWDFVSLTPESAHGHVADVRSRHSIAYRNMQGFGVPPSAWSTRPARACWSGSTGDRSRDLLAGLGRGAEARRQGPRLQPADPLGGHREGRLSRMGAGPAGDPGEPAGQLRLRPARPHQAGARGLVPVRVVGRMVLNRNPDNFFAETEQVAFHVGHVVPGIDFTNDPLLQGRLFSHTDTQLLRLERAELQRNPDQPPAVSVPQLTSDAPHRRDHQPGRASWEPNSIDGGWPEGIPPAGLRNGGFSTYHEPVSGSKLRKRADFFADPFPARPHCSGTA